MPRVLMGSGRRDPVLVAIGPGKGLRLPRRATPLRVSLNDSDALGVPRWVGLLIRGDFKQIRRAVREGRPLSCASSDAGVKQAIEAAFVKKYGPKAARTELWERIAVLKDFASRAFYARQAGISHNILYLLKDYSVEGRSFLFKNIVSGDEVLSAFDKLWKEGGTKNCDGLFKEWVEQRVVNMRSSERKEALKLFVEFGDLREGGVFKALYSRVDLSTSGRLLIFAMVWKRSDSYSSLPSIYKTQLKATVRSEPMDRVVLGMRTLGTRGQGLQNLVIPVVFEAANSNQSQEDLVASLLRTYRLTAKNLDIFELAYRSCTLSDASRLALLLDLVKACAAGRAVALLLADLPVDSALAHMRVAPFATCFARSSGIHDFLKALLDTRLKDLSTSAQGQMLALMSREVAGPASTHFLDLATRLCRSSKTYPVNATGPLILRAMKGEKGAEHKERLGKFLHLVLGRFSVPNFLLLQSDLSEEDSGRLSFIYSNTAPIRCVQELILIGGVDLSFRVDGQSLIDSLRKRLIFPRIMVSRVQLDIDRTGLQASQHTYRYGLWALLSGVPLNQGLHVTFRHESGSDYGGLRNEFLRVLGEGLMKGMAPLAQSAAPKKYVVENGMWRMLMECLQRRILPVFEFKLLLPVLYRRLPETCSIGHRLHFIILMASFFDRQQYQQWAGPHHDLEDIVENMIALFEATELIDDASARAVLDTLVSIWVSDTPSLEEELLDRLLFRVAKKMKVNLRHAPMILALLLAGGEPGPATSRLSRFIRKDPATGQYTPVEGTLLFLDETVTEIQVANVVRLLRDLAEEEDTRRAAGEGGPGVYTLFNMLLSAKVDASKMEIVLVPSDKYPVGHTCFSRVDLPVPNSAEAYPEFLAKIRHTLDLLKKNPSFGLA